MARVERVAAAPEKGGASKALREALEDKSNAAPTARLLDTAQNKFSRNPQEITSKSLATVARSNVHVAKVLSAARIKDSFEAAQETAAHLNNKFRYKPLQSALTPQAAGRHPFGRHRLNASPILLDGREVGLLHPTTGL